MELKIDLKKLQEALSVCIKFVQKRAMSIPWMKNFIFRDQFVYVTDSILGIYHKIECNFGNGFMVRAEDFNEYIQKSEGDEIVLNINEEDSTMVVKAGRKKATFVLDMRTDKVSYVPGMTIDCKKLENDFRENLLSVKMSMSDSLFSMNGIFLHNGYAYATNGSSSIRCECKSWPSGDIFLPRAIVKMIDDFKDLIPLGLAVIENFIFIKYENFVIFHRRVEEADNHRIEVLVDRFNSFLEGAVSFSFDGAEAIKSLSRVSVFAEREDRMISLVITGNQLSISSQGKVGRCQEDLEIKRSKPLLQGALSEAFELDHRYFMRLLEIGNGLIYNNGLVFFSKSNGLEYIFMSFIPQ